MVAKEINIHLRLLNLSYKVTLFIQLKLYYTQNFNCINKLNNNPFLYIRSINTKAFIPIINDRNESYFLNIGNNIQIIF